MPGVMIAWLQWSVRTRDERRGSVSYKMRFLQDDLVSKEGCW